MTSHSLSIPETLIQILPPLQIHLNYLRAETTFSP